MFRNAGEALVAKLDETLQAGRRIVVRGHETLELSNQSIVLEHPLERAAIVDGRRNNVFAAIAETAWVLAGRDDIDYLERYLPRARDFSDDGVTWRGAYGPRLRCWHGVDQIREVCELLRRDPSTRRAVMSIFDPAQDYRPSRDIPCTNWLQAEIRDGRLNLSVVMRSNDLVWGFSGINAFEWSVLQEMLAFWAGCTVGELRFFVGSLHVYDRHFHRAEEIVRGGGAHSPPVAARFATGPDDLDEQLQRLFDVEAAAVHSRSAAFDLAVHISDPLLRDFATMLIAYRAFSLGEVEVADKALAMVQDSSLVAAGRYYFAWKSGESRQFPAPEAGEVEQLRVGIGALHRVKDAAYGDSWKRRGERSSILPNVARKLDRFRAYAPGADPSDETWLDTAVDLLVYAVKYRTYLLDAAGTETDWPGTWSDGPDGFERCMDRLAWPDASGEVQAISADAEGLLERLERAVDTGSPVDHRLSLVDEFVEAAARLLLVLVETAPWRAKRFMRSWSALSPTETEEER